MELRIYLPSGIFLQKRVDKVKGESPEGGFCLLPRHIDYVVAVVPSIFSFTCMNGGDFYLALDNGLLVKQGLKVSIAVRRAVGGELGSLHREVRKMILVSDERERTTRSAVAKLEAGFLRRFMDFNS